MELSTRETTVNPFESPLSTEPAIRLPHDGDPLDQRGRGPVSMFFIGAIMGGIVAAVAGAVGAAMLGGIGGIFRHSMDDGLGLAIVGAIFGAFTGVCAGIPFGAILGIAYGFCKPRSRKWLTLSTAGISALIGSGVGWMGGQMLAGFPRADTLFLSAGITTIIGVLCGGTAGVVGGWLLARLLAVTCWGHAPTPR
ncbi:MAG: hypothetical protein K8T91_12435 [Planctomycetes bacterium]|nr:hypothetical protein [Planctomycetota bacterium]